MYSIRIYIYSTHTHTYFGCHLLVSWAKRWKRKTTWQGRGARVTRRSFVQDVISVVPGQLVLHSCHFEADLKSPFIRHLPNVFDLQPSVTDLGDIDEQKC